jgi:spermidine synthase
MPCGHGRVLRALRAAYPDAEIVACELEADGVDFCAKTFGAVPVYSKEDPGEIELHRTFDLIWVGSLFTHISAERWPAFLNFFDRVLAPDGVLVFTIHGEAAARIMRERRKMFSHKPEELDTMLAEYAERGFSYCDYKPGSNYGTSISAPDWVKKQITNTAELALLGIRESGWTGSQDAVICVKRAEMRRG